MLHAIETKTLKIKKELHQLLKVHCAKKSLKISNFVESLIEKELKNNRESK